MPIAVINLFLTWIILSLIFLGLPKFRSSPKQATSTEDTPLENSSEQVARVLRRKLDELGKISFHEWTIIVLITIAVLLWLFRDPQVFPGWFSLFSDTHPRIGDSTVAVAILVIMFIVPKDVSYFRGGMHKHCLNISKYMPIQKFQNLLDGEKVLLVGNLFNNIFRGT